MDDSQTFRDGDYTPGFRSEQKRSDSCEISCVSMKSDASMGKPLTFKGEDTSPDQRSAHQKRSDSPKISCVSMKSDQSLMEPLKFKDTSPDHRSLMLSGSYSSDQIRVSVSDQTISDLQSDERDSHSSSYCRHLPEVLNTFRSNLRKKFECLCEGTSDERNPTLLNEIYTELYITESESGEISNEHEVRQIETQSRRTATEDTPIKCNDIFKALPAQDKPIRSVLTKGVAGIGKTVSVQKFILDWAEGKENQDVHLIFPLPFREINLMKNQTLSLLHLLHLFFPETKEMEISSGEYKVLFIFDGLDECRVSLDFHSSVRLCDVSESASVDVMLTNLMKGNLLPSALIWITSRPAAADLIPSECVDRVTEVRGFTDKQKEEYFSKRISDESLNNRIISHLKSSRSLYIMCHIPVFCWISATVLERMLSEAESEGEIPKTLTQMYTHFLIIQTNIKHQKDYEKKVKNDEDMIFKLAKLAFEQLVKGNLIFYDEDLRECGIDVAEASVYSGLCTQIFREEFGLYQGKVYCFVHLSIQEHLAALYAHISIRNNKRNVFAQGPEVTVKQRKPEILGWFSTILDIFKSPVLLCEFHHRAVDEALKSQNGHLDLFLRFLLGLSLESNQILLQDLLTHMRRCSYKKEKTVEYIKQKISENLSPEKSINLIHCLNELGDDSLLQEIQHYVKSESVGKSKLSSSQWSALVFVLLMSEQHLDELDLKKFIGGQNKADEVLVKLMPVIKEYRKLNLSQCKITDEGCVALTSALRSNPSHLRHLDLSDNNVGDSGVKLISTVLENPHCKLETLKLRECKITDEGCVALTSALRSNPSHLRHLDLCDNNVEDSGVKLISTVLENPHCELETLTFWRCEITDEGCVALTSALRSNPSHLRHLDLFGNNVGDSGVKLISTVLENLHCKLETLKLSWCEITDEGCVALTSALRSNPSHLRHLDLSDNNVGDSGVKLISTALENPHCKLETLTLMKCKITEEGCVALTSALRSNPSHLRHLDLSDNNVGDSGVKLISTVLENPHCKLETLKLRKCKITDEGCDALTSALRLNPSHLRHLDLCYNNVGDSGVKLISTVLENPHCKLETLTLNWCKITITDEGCVALTSDQTLRDSEVKLICDVLENPHCKLKTLKLNRCKITDEGCVALTSALRSNPSHLRHLDLSDNNVGDSGVKLISTVLENPHCKLETLKLRECKITDEGCVALTSALRSNPSYLRHLDLYYNNVGDSGVKLISTVLENPHCKLETLKLSQCKITDEGCVALTSALRSNPSHLKHLELFGNNLGDSVKKLLCELRDDPHYKLKTVVPHR
ncbi:NACHT, LRR and PYD domains-containing protein 12-like [Triplophysa dalaica]|uniref:NACHT, LRR and PYD domains-containing protein 12-like n=1 Tax=Triplophysa dalaica TaxID=1582913 RepID=UPI0024DF6A40|nr:NACHT, LRR and PYD domains-containing protein 12-like [Triplophysa dalaica]